MVTIVTLSSVSRSQSLIYFRVAGIGLFRFPVLLEAGDLMQTPGAFLLGPTERASAGVVLKSGLRAPLYPSCGVIFDELLLLCEPLFSLCKMGLRIILTLWGSGEGSVACPWA